MKKKIIFFSIDRLGDYLIRSNLIKQISKEYKSSEIICSNINYKLISNQTFFSNVTKFDLNKKNLNKITFITKYFLKKYDTVIAFDGKTISYLLIFIIRAENKFTFIYKKKGIYNSIILEVFKFLLKLFKINFEILNNREIIEDGNLDNYPIKYKFLNKFYKTASDEIYYLDNSKKNIFSKYKNDYILIHLDDKFNDIKDIESNFTESLIKLSKEINKKIFLTSFKNECNYYKNLKIDKKKFPLISYNTLEETNMLIIEDIPINDFQNAIENSFYNISSHSGYFVHTSLALKKKTIDIINEKDEKWLLTWIFNSKNHKFIYKSKSNNFININKVVDNLKNEIGQI